MYLKSVYLLEVDGAGDMSLFVKKNFLVIEGEYLNALSNHIGSSGDIRVEKIKQLSIFHD